MLRGNAEISSVSVCIHAVACREKSIEPGLVLIHLLSRLIELLLLLWIELLRLGLLGHLLLLLVERIQSLLLWQRGELRHGLRSLRSVKLCERVVRARRCWFHCLLLLGLVCGPRVVAAGLRCWLRSLHILRLILLQILLHRIRVVACRLLLELRHRLLAVRILAHASLLHTEALLIVGISSLVRLEAGVGILHEACRLWLHLILVNGVGKKVHLIALLVSLIETGRLGLAGLRRFLAKKSTCVALLELTASSFILLLAKLNSLGQVVIVLIHVVTAFSVLSILLFLVFAGLEGQAVFSVLLVIGRVPTVVCTSIGAFDMGRRMLFQPSHSRFP